MRILWNEATSGAPELDLLWDALRGYFPKVARDDTEVVLRHAPVSANYVRSLYTELLNNRAVVENTIAAERDGFDAVVLGCWAEAAMLLATTLGFRFAVITVAPGVIPTIEMDLRLYGLEDRAIARPVRTLDPPSDMALLLESVTEPDRRLIPNFERVARECIQDGAEVIVVGCGYYGPILTLHGYNEVPGTGVPVVDCSAAGLKLAEVLADLRKSTGLRKSTALYFQGAPREVLDRVRRVHGLT
jgi:allantoin racemase